MPQAKSAIETLNLEYRIFEDDNVLSFIEPLVREAFPEYTPPQPSEPEPQEELKEEAKIEIPVPASPPPAAEPAVKGKKPKAAAPPPPPEPEPEEEQEKPKKKREPVLFEDWDKYHDRTEAWNDVCYQILHEPLFIKRDEKDFIVLEAKEKVEQFFERYFMMGSFSRQWFEYDMRRREASSEK